MPERKDDGAVPVESPLARTRHGELTLDQIGTMQMGLARLMREYGDRFWTCYYAAKAGNWRLATYMLNNIQKLHQYGGQTRPKLKPWLDQFEDAHIKPLKAITRREDWSAFEPAHQAAVDAANALHAELGYAYIFWTLPAQAPPQLRMTPPIEPP